METTYGAETEGKATQRLSYLRNHPINSHQIPTLLWTAVSALPKEPVIVFSRGALPESYRYRGRFQQPTIRLGGGFTMEELEDGLEEPKEFTVPWEEQ